MGRGRREGVIDWGRVAEIALKEAKEYYERNGFAITLRGLYYILMSKGVIPGTKQAYNNLSRAVSQARYRSKFPWHLIRDVTRKSYSLERSEYYADRELSEDELKQILESYIQSYFSVSVNPWNDQPNRIIILVEKEALLDAVTRVVNEVFPFGVYKIICTKGYDSATNIHEMAKLLKAIKESGQTPVVLALGDFDPSGEDIPRDARERLEMLSGTTFIFEKVAVTKKHVLTLGLPPAPESPEEEAKLRRDPRFKGYYQRLMSDPEIRGIAEKYGGLVRIELDAMVALKPDVFKEELRKAIERYFSWDIYNNVTKPREEELKKKTEEMRQKTLERMAKLISGGGQ